LTAAGPLFDRCLTAVRPLFDRRIDSRDVAAVAARLLLAAPEGAGGARLSLTGPAAVGMDDVVRRP
jgi:hypothetical protein